MKKYFSQTLLAIAIPASLSISSVYAESINIQSNPEKKTSFIVKLKSKDSKRFFATHRRVKSEQKMMRHMLSQMAKRSNMKPGYVRPLGLAQYHVVSMPEQMSELRKASFITQLEQNPQIDSVQEDKLLQIAAAPNDPRYAEQWHYFEENAGLNLPLAWGLATGENVNVAVLDTGYLAHPDLVGNILPGYDMISDPARAVDGDGRDQDALDPGDGFAAGECGRPRGRDSSWHGTHVSGTIAAVANNNIGVAGVAYQANIVPVRVLGKCGGSVSDIADGIVWAAGGQVLGVPDNANPAKVINMSLGGLGACTSAFQDAINFARSQGTVIVTAAGNESISADRANPGNCNGVINVAALSRDGNLAPYSNFGPTIDVAAPGGLTGADEQNPDGVLSTSNSGTTTAVNNDYRFYEGTSMAAPHVAGAVALIAELEPEMTPDEIEKTLKATARDSGCNQCGDGLVDANAAVEEVFFGGPIPGIDPR
ncbi:S8 family peptidase [Algicola sagamiensis]|uniref:S8 family peptidase n=1 Tax=Algicola sagamiensis TaxID=163869 RepID=UPI00036D7426|nr:S8 family peptidase [Algicola sagamiensis]